MMWGSVERTPLLRVRPRPQRTAALVATAALALAGALCVGAFSTLFFHTSLVECGEHLRAAPTAADPPMRASFGPLGWFLLPEFYAVGLSYMLSRLVVNLSQVYLPFLVLDSLGSFAESFVLVSSDFVSDLVTLPVTSLIVHLPDASARAL